MARAVAELDGDSSGLVGAIDQGKKAMGQMEAEGKKLSDQLREVTDSVDKAAGALVNKIGGPKAIAAIAGAGAAFGAAKMGVDFFLNSVEKLFKSMGDDGMKVWNDVEKALDSITGAFAKAVLGGGSAEDMGKKLITVFQGLATVVEFLVTYGMPMLRVAFEALYWIMDKLGQITKDDADKFDALKRAQDTYASASSVTNVQNLQKAYADLSTTINGLVGDQAELALGENDKAMAGLIALQGEITGVGNKLRDLAIRKEVQKAHDVIVRQAEEQVANMDFSYAGMGWKIEKERALTEAIATLEADRYSSVAKQMAAAGKDAYSFLPEALKLTFDSAAADLSKLDERGRKLYEQYLGHDENKPKTGTGGGAPKPPKTDPVVEAIAAAQKKAEAAAAAAKKETDTLSKTIQDSYDNFGMGITRILFGRGDMKTSFEILGEEIKSVWQGVVEDTVAGIDEVGKATEKVEEQHSAFYDKWVANQARMIGTAIGNGEKMADIGRKSIGMVISGLGEEMLARASIATFSGNFAGAAGLTAAAAAAFAAATALGASGKKTASATAATAPTSSPVTNNTSYNLQIDAAFADEESIARSFAKAQALARVRHVTYDSTSVQY